MRSHVALHLEHIALFALPEFIDLENESDIGDDQAVMGSAPSTDDFDFGSKEGSLEFDDRVAVDASDETYLSVSS